MKAEVDEDDGFDADWTEEAGSNVDAYLLLIDVEDGKDVDVGKAFAVSNAEIRQAIIKRLPHEAVEKAVKRHIHKDKDMKLLQLINGEVYVQVKDSSTERIYHLNVPTDAKTCREAVAWTFGLPEDAYKPEIET